jgi:hypothetical protein
MARLGAELRRLDPCPLMPACVAAGTLIALPGDTSKLIEELRVGDRVATTSISSDLPDGATRVDPINWLLVKMRMSSPTDADDVYEVTTLRSVAWIVEHRAFPGGTIEFETERSPVDEAYIVSVERAPAIKPGHGRVALSTFTHRDQILTIAFEGNDDPFNTTPSHRPFSIDRGEWACFASATVFARAGAIDDRFESIGMKSRVCSISK